MCRTRDERMYLTEKYQAKQMRIEQKYYPYVDEFRYYHTPLKRMMKALLGIEIDYEWNTKHRPTGAVLGRMRKNSWRMCPCVMCRGPRHQPWNKHRDKLTQPERKNEDSYKSQLADLDQAAGIITNR